MQVSSPMSFVYDEMPTKEEESKKKRIRQMQNRQSAAQYRERKKDYLEKLEVVVEKLEGEKSMLIANTESLVSSQNEVNLKISILEEKIDLLVKRNRELKFTLAHLAKTADIAIESELLQDPIGQHERKPYPTTPSPSITVTPNSPMSSSSSTPTHHHHLHHHQQLQQQHQSGVNTPVKMSTFNLEGNRSILNNDEVSELGSSIGSPSSSASSPVRDLTSSGGGRSLSDSNERYIDKFSSISISSLSSSGEREHGGGSGNNSVNSSIDLANFHVVNPRVSGSNSTGGGSSGSGGGLSSSNGNNTTSSNYKHHQHKRSRDFTMDTTSPMVMTGSSIHSLTTSGEREHGPRSLNTSGSNNNNNSYTLSSSSTQSIQSTQSTTMSTSPTTPYSPMNMGKLPSLSSSGSAHSQHSSYTPLASFSSILSLTSPTSSPLITSLPSSPSASYLSPPIETFSSSPSNRYNLIGVNGKTTGK
ncbi:hypothetical protein SAMD00019534_053150 [Acytostelium subglobosum LB1]|uniref:hypothetical protein n=1 Tax=Acytostelium subglobosum LB1 TaxID=1410327 RepID=UPI000644C01A|nr:hypothetical protein SAMD00019534_053150 [Acytostelium subglobosum LB1]GAM22140.1 hypothetical protein SAMD00019534_053150 [Acytostelium subglobosum LB1]|eukprot:XP_012755240.1 hypothetical protein SAMD00019534_053150 [Acytostelium subglobosum LB1]